MPLTPAQWSELRAFLAKIREARGDDRTACLAVFADWLADHTDDREHMIRRIVENNHPWLRVYDYRDGTRSVALSLIWHTSDPQLADADCPPLELLSQRLAGCIRGYGSSTRFVYDECELYLKLRFDVAGVPILMIRVQGTGVAAVEFVAAGIVGCLTSLNEFQQRYRMTLIEQQPTHPFLDTEVSIVVPLS